MDTQSQTTKTAEQTKASEANFDANHKAFIGVHKNWSETLKAYLENYELHCTSLDIVPEIKLSEMTEDQIETAVQGLMGAMGVVNSGPVERNVFERYVLFYPAMGVGALAGVIDSVFCHIPGYRKNIKAGFSQGFGFGSYLERRVYEGARNQVVNTKEKLTQAYENRKKEKSAKSESTKIPDLQPA